MSEQQVVDLLLNGSLEAFLDCLDFAPLGVMDLVKKFAVDLPMTDYAKCEALKNKTGFDAMAAVRNKRADEKEAAEDAAAASAKTNAGQDSITPAATTTTTTPRRRSNTNYKVVEKKTEG